MAQQIAHAAAEFQQQRTGHQPKSVSAVLDGNTLVVTLQGALSPAEHVLVQSPAGAAKIQEFHKQLFQTASGELRQEIQRITGMKVLETASEIKPESSGTVVQIFTNGTMVQVYLLSGKVPTEGYHHDQLALIRKTE